MQSEIGPERLSVFRAMAGPKADRYIAEILLPVLARGCGIRADNLSAIRTALEDPYACLRLIYSYYAFSRRGKDRREFSSAAVDALAIIHRSGEFETFLDEPDASRLWEAFVRVCRQESRRPMEQLNLGVVAGLAELMQEIHRAGGSGSIASWIAEGVIRTDRIEPQFMRMVDIRGVGPKLCATLARDIVFVYGLEDAIDHIDRLYVQPIDRWMRAISPYVVEELSEAGAADWILAGKVSKYARRSGVSGIRFNMGVGYFGQRECQTPALFEEGIEAIMRPSREVVARPQAVH